MGYVSFREGIGIYFPQHIVHTSLNRLTNLSANAAKKKQDDSPATAPPAASLADKDPTGIDRNFQHFFSTEPKHVGPFLARLATPPAKKTGGAGGCTWKTTEEQCAETGKPFSAWVHFFVAFVVLFLNMATV